MLSEEEKDLVSRLKQEGYQTNDIVSHIGAKRLGAESAIDKDKLKKFQEKNNEPVSNKIAEGLGFGKAVDTFGSVLARRGIGTDVAPETVQQFVAEPSTREKVGAVLQTGSVLIPGGAGANLARQVGTSAAAGYLYDIGSDLAQNKSTQEALTPGVGTVASVLIPPALRGGQALLSRGSRAMSGAGSKVAEGLSQAGSGISDAISDVVPQGVKQIGTEVAERFPRAIEKGKDVLEEASIRAERIKNAPPAVQDAIRSGVDDVVIDAIEKADEPTKQAYKRMVEIAESPRTGLRPATRPESIAGESVAEQYKILDTQRRNVGSQLGDEVDKLSKKGEVDILPAQRTMRDLLRVNGILPDMSGKLNFKGSSLTPKQQTLVQQLYDTATQSETMTPRQVYNMDKLFSQLQREARFDGIDNLYLTTPEGDINAFRAFRNIFSNELDRIAPEIKPLNQQYAQLRNLQDDIEGSIVKRGNFESTRNVDPAEFAQTNLRRAFSDAQSAADYRELADKLDAFARANGYKGANPLDLAGFAQRLRNIYPETVPETSAQGLFGGGIKGAFEKVMNLGAPGVTDQQKALKSLLGVTDEQASVKGQSFAGGVTGVEEDENGEKKFDPLQAMAGIAGMAVLGKLKPLHMDDVKLFESVAYEKAKNVSPEKMKLIRDTLSKGYGMEVPKKDNDVIDFVTMLVENRVLNK